MTFSEQSKPNARVFGDAEHLAKEVGVFLKSHGFWRVEKSQEIGRGVCRDPKYNEKKVCKDFEQ